MKIGIDIDGVLTDLEQFSIDYLSKYCVENHIDYNITPANEEAANCFGISSEDLQAFWNEYLEFYAQNGKARQFASEIIKKLKADGHEIYIITSRTFTNRDDLIGKNMRNITINWLADNEMVYDYLIFSKLPAKRKVPEITENKIDVMIEDNSNNINEISKSIPVICFDTPYNRECFGSYIYRCYSWYDIYNKLNYIEALINEASR